MARWELKQPHYLNVPGTKWRYEETDRNSGESVSQEYAVPRLLDPNNPRDCRSQGLCVVYQGEGKGQRGDWLFVGEPTPDMDPLDEEAEAISEKFRYKWTHPVDTLPTNGGMNEEESNFMKHMMEAFSNAASNAGNKSVSREDFNKLQEQVAALAARNAELEAAKSDKTRRA